MRKIKGMLNLILNRSFFAVALLLFNQAQACGEGNSGADLETTARLTTYFGLKDYVIEIVRPKDSLSAHFDACLVFKGNAHNTIDRYSFELGLPGQFGLHVVKLNRDYLVVDSGTAIGAFETEIYSVEHGKPAYVKTIGSTTTPNYVSQGNKDYALTTGDGRQIIKTLLNQPKSTSR